MSTKTVPCSECNGKGYYYSIYSGKDKCKKCNGTGKVQVR